ncbi:unnamed protein product [Clonostachys chloroleuca]|uniref:Alcohol dehydrogenase-like N-terminal domain-containing protein n=1 Tax=Clonostachys chloroleuca TaxID=1926264 RepID=A0AA35LQI4_9HYPO|nr:unnamed protein product [Clonostachys chloroleuca]
MTSDYKFEGWVADDASSAEGNLTWRVFKPKTWEETDVEIKISHSAICVSDIHTLRDGWGGKKYPCVMGHEIVGKLVRVGSQAGDFKCKKRINAYDSVHRNGDTAHGGFALYTRCPSHFVIRIPRGLAPEHAAPILCGGVTVYSPLKRFGVGPGTSVGIVGIGGLGHFAILFAKALGASRVVAISRRADKRADGLEPTSICFGYCHYY